MILRLSALIAILVLVISCKTDLKPVPANNEEKPKPTYKVVSGLDNSTANAVKPPPSAAPKAAVQVKRNKTQPLIEQVDVQNPEFKVRMQKEDFDQILTFLGSRTLNGESEDIKFKLFLWEDKIRGYYETVYGGKNIQVFGYIDGERIALKSLNNSVPQENAAEMTGTLKGDQLDLTFKKGEIGEDGVIKVAKTDIEYPLIFYRTEDLIKYGKKR
jgi:hypothetical protein